MMKTTTPQRRLRLVTLAFLALGVFMMAQTGMAQQNSEDYKVSILKRNSVAVGDSEEIVVRVRTLQGQLAHGIPVRFQLDPGGQKHATIVPEQTTTDHGIARAKLHSDLIGRVGLTVRVGHGTVVKRTGLAFKTTAMDAE
jgi:hypothetical protein